MARWLIQRTHRGNGGISVFYDNLLTGMRWPLGKLSSDVSDQMVVDWIFKYGGPAYGDTIVLSDGARITYHAPDPSAAAA